MAKLKYLFEAVYHDGTVYKQNPDDISVKFGVGKSCMSDIQEDVDAGKIKLFRLIQQTIFNPTTLSLDLTTAQFDLNGVKLWVEGDRPLPVAPGSLRLIFYRVRRENRVLPARYVNPEHCTPIGKGVWVTTSKGVIHKYPEVVKFWTEENKEIVNGEEKTNTFLFVQPPTPLTPLQYMLGWQTEISGKNYQQKILID